MTNLLIYFFISSIWLLLNTDIAFAEEALPAIDSGSVAWVLAATAMVVLMTLPGLALFYGGLSRSKNVLSTIMYSFTSLALVSIVWVLWGYSLAFGEDISGVIGSLAHLGLSGIPLPGSEVAPNINMGLTIPDSLFVVFQGVFAVITVALISGSYAERFKFGAFILFSVMWVTFIYAPLAHWVWGGGWLARIGALDFAGGTVVHIASGISGLAASMYLGKRIGYGNVRIIPHNVPMVVTGAGLLWFGWFGFNAGSAVAADGLAASAFLATNTAAAAAALSWLGIEWIHGKSPTAIGIASGSVAGLVAITPAAGFVTPMASVVIGTLAGVLCYFAVYYKHKMGYDDALDVFGIHAVGGTWGALATGIFASTSITGPTGARGLLEGNPAQLWIQIEATIATLIFCFVGSAIILKVVDLLVGLRPDPDSEVIGLNQAEHCESPYN
ncbi:MAG TPA: ammonium transporter [Nitrospinota bacterium]|nr:ammonium transporter [Nitrospinota bacterium]|tara:strand:- start:12402 stop:13727 length:1326 start_codon:yes stop_codon:yes gene_type:complete